MKKLTSMLLLLAASTSAFAQQRNSLLQPDFWKQNPTVEIVKTEIAKGNDPAQPDQRQMDPTTIAINNDASLEVLKFMVDQKGNSVTKGTHNSRTYLHWAAGRGNVDFVKYLVSRGADVDKIDSHGSSPAAFAASAGQSNLDLYNTLFKSPADIKMKNSNGASLLLVAIAADKDFKLLDYFTKNGLSIKDVDADGATAFDYAAKGGNIEHMKKVVAKGAKATNHAVLFASQGGRNFAAGLDVYKYLVEDLKLNPLAKNKDGNTVLHNIVRKPNQEEIIKYFLAKGADVNTLNEEGSSAFFNAVGGRDLAAIEFLADKVKDINAVNKKGESALAIAVASSSAEVVSFLLNKGANVNVIDAAGNNLAYYLIQSYRPAMGGRGGEGRPGAPKDDFTEKLAFLTAKGFDVARPQKNGNTLYHLAIGTLDLPLLKKVSSYKVDINAKNAEGSTVLHKAALISKDDRVLNFLLAAGADKSLKTDFDETAYDLAKENKFLSGKNIAVDFLK